MNHTLLIFTIVAVTALVGLILSEPSEFTGEATKSKCPPGKKELVCGRSCGCVAKSAGCASMLCKGSKVARFCPNEIFNPAIHCPLIKVKKAPLSYPTRAAL